MRPESDTPPEPPPHASGVNARPAGRVIVAAGEAGQRHSPVEGRELFLRKREHRRFHQQPVAGVRSPQPVRIPHRKDDQSGSKPSGESIDPARRTPQKPGRRHSRRFFWRRHDG